MSANRQLIGWKAYFFRDGKIVVYSSKEYSWNQLPQDGFQVMVRYFDDNTRDLENGSNLYVFDNTQVNEIKSLSINVKAGKYIDTETFLKILKQAQTKSL